MSKVADEVLQSGKYHVYPEYKDSGVDWLGTIPFHWEKSRIGFEASIKARLGWKGLKADEYVEDGYIFLATPNIKGSEIDFNNVNYITKFRYDESPEIKINVGDVLVTKDGSTTGTCNIVRKLPSPATVNSSIAVIRPIRNLVSEYLYYFFLSPYTQSVIKLMQGGMGVPHLFQADLCEFNILLPPMNEQRTIAAFLDYETARIDQLIAKQQRLIELLKEKRQAVISHVVTKGLNPDAPMKDSGIEWLGQIPDHWLSNRVGWCCQVGNGCTPSRDNMDYWSEGTYPWLNSGKVNDGYIISAEQFVTVTALKECSLPKVPAGSIVMAITGEGKTRGSVAMTGIDTTLSQHLAFITVTSKKLSPMYLRIWLESQYQRIRFESEGWGSTKAAITCSDIKSYPLPEPPLNEQLKIVEYVGERSKTFDLLIQKSESMISFLQERRTALISAAVTGKIDLRGWIPPAEEAAT
ncbi:restriction endonuclease subunit S [Aeromonas veronii]|uniref:restriction endonuclease subunit S n=1 Tax=Aeromonas veronii TaxID=654 RepID=UPI00406CF76F